MFHFLTQYFVDDNPRQRNQHKNISKNRNNYAMEVENQSVGTAHSITINYRETRKIEKIVEHKPNFPVLFLSTLQ